MILYVLIVGILGRETGDRTGRRETVPLIAAKHPGLQGRTVFGVNVKPERGACDSCSGIDVAQVKPQQRMR